MQKTRVVAKIVFVGAILATGFWVSAGDLNPPAGPIAPTQRTPIGPNTTPGDADATPSSYKISAAGSYYLAGNITGESGKIGIEIAASGVTLDLNGFELLGVAGSVDGVRTTVADLTNIAVVNGSVRNWGGKGVDLAFAPFPSHNGRVADVIASGNGNTGIFAGANYVVTRCTARQNGGFGIATSSGSTITNCAATGNTVNGFQGSGGCTIADCAAYLNVGNGIGSGGGSTITRCSATDNGGYGIFAHVGTVVTDCFAGYNTGDGIVAFMHATIRGNSCVLNGDPGDGAGIHATAADNRIEGNNCTLNDRGIDVDVGGNFIARNTCSGNTTNWDVAAGNVCLVVSGTTGAAILGDSGGSAPGSTDPNANFTY
jgi:parallel beta-helix repeat protein